MKLNAIEIFKYLPGGKKTENANCKKCGFPTCMAFALKLASFQVDTSKCKFIPLELLDIISELSKKQQKEICLNDSIKIGNETVMFRHEKTFVNKPPIAISLYASDLNFNNKLNDIFNYKFERVGESFKIDVIYLIDDLTENQNFNQDILIDCIDKVLLNNFILILNTQNKDIILKYKNSKIIFDTDQFDIFSDLQENKNIFKNKPMIISSDSLKQLDSKVSCYKNLFQDNLILNYILDNKSVYKIVEDLTYLRRLAILKRYENFAFPVMTHIKSFDLNKINVLASLLICRYSSLIILDVFDKSLLSALFTLIQTIYTDPQKPLQVESKIYEINEPDENSSIVMTTNFALTYFAVSNELESINDSSFYLVITPSDGMSVLTAWSAEKFTSEMVAKMINESEKLKANKKKELILPGLLDHIKEDIEDLLPDWNIIVGPIEAYKLPEFLNSRKNKEKTNSL